MHARRSLGGITVGAVVIITPVLAVSILPTATTQSARALEAPVSSTAQLESAPLQVALTQKVYEALNATEWPAGFESQIGIGGGIEEEYALCSDPQTAPEDGCAWGEGERSVIVVGDSIAGAYLPTLRNSFDSADWTTRSFAMNGCQFSSLDLTSGSAKDRCASRKAAAINAITETKPDVVIVATHFSVSRLPGASENLTFDEWQRGFHEQLELVTPHASQTLIVTPPPYEKQITECFTSASRPSDCTSSPTHGYGQRVAAVLAIDDARVVTVVDSAPWFCYSDLCPAFVNGTLTKADMLHPNQVYMRQIQPVVEEALDGVVAEQ